MPKQWKPGEPISAERLNDTNAEALRSRRDVNLGSGSSMVNEAMGNQSSSPRHQAMKLVVAVEDFSVSETPTDLNGVIDDVPSGMVKELRLNRRSGVHSKNETQRSFRAYDVTAGLTGVFCDAASDSASASASASQSASESGPATSGKQDCDVFYVMFNQDSKRWEVMAAGGGSGAPRIRFTILSTDFTVGFGALGCDHVVVLVNHVSCSGTGVAVGDEVRVYDPEYCHFNLPVELLVGLSGTATWMKSENYQDGLDAIDSCIADLRAARCMWMIDTLCCAEEETLNG